MSARPPFASSPAYRDVIRHVAELPAADVLRLIKEIASRPDVAALIHERNVRVENDVRRIFGEPPYPPDRGPLLRIDLQEIDQ